MWIEQMISLFDDSTVDEVFFNRSHLMVCGQYRHEVKKEIFVDSVDALEKIQEFSFSQGLRLDPGNPFTGGTFRNYRWSAAIPPISVQGPIFTLRRHRFGDLGVDDFDGYKEHGDLIKSEWNNKSSVLICGPTGSGKTSLLTCLLRQYSFGERVFILEDLEEIPILSPHWVSLRTQAQREIGRAHV